MGFPGVGTVSILVLALVGGCNVEQGGIGTNSGTAESSGGGGSTAAEMTSSTSRGTDADSSGSTAGSSTGASGTGSVDGTTGTSTGTSMPGSSSSGSEGETGSSVEPGQAYGPCAPGGECMGDDVVCYEDGGLSMCLPPCDGTNPSCPPPPADNTSLVECVQVMGIHCMLNCAEGGDRSCPSGTDCVNIGGGIFRCLWP
jgi:hypothetical protein